MTHAFAWSIIVYLSGIAIALSLLGPLVVP